MNFSKKSRSNSMLYKISDEEFKKIVETSSSLADVIRKLGYANGHTGRSARDNIKKKN